MILKPCHGHDICSASSPCCLWSWHGRYWLRHNYPSMYSKMDDDLWKYCQFRSHCKDYGCGRPYGYLLRNLYKVVHLSLIRQQMWQKVYCICESVKLYEHIYRCQMSLNWDGKLCSTYMVVSSNKSGITNFSWQRTGHPILCQCFGLQLANFTNHTFACFCADGFLAAKPMYCWVCFSSVNILGSGWKGIKIG